MTPREKRREKVSKHGLKRGLEGGFQEEKKEEASREMRSEDETFYSNLSLSHFSYFLHSSDILCLLE
jgi:hypothetical protein